MGDSGMTITLRPEHEEIVAEALRSGAYKTPDEVIGRGLELLREQEKWVAENRTKIEAGYAAAQRGELMDGDQVRADMREKKRAWTAENRRA